MEYEIIVVGGGHAGCEAALASARMNKKTLMITMNKNNIADMPCNPSIGGPAKGIVVREISALGGEMANNIDKSFLQMKMLNTKKGPAVRSLRAQADKITYKKEMLKTLENQENLDILEDMVKELLIEDNKIIGVLTENNKEIYSKAVILTTGTYLKSSILVGSSKTSSGPHDEKTCKTLSDDLKKYGFTIKRLKTGTPPRIEKSSIDYSKATIQPGDDTCWNFSVYNELNYETDKQIPCYLIYTTTKTHEIIKENLAASFQSVAVESIVSKVKKAIIDKKIKNIIVAGGVAANQGLRNEITKLAKELNVELIIPPINYCTDNAAMIAAAGYYAYKKGRIADLNLNSKSQDKLV